MPARGYRARLEEIAESATSPSTTAAAAAAMGDAMRDAVTARIGGDMRMSRFDGSAVRLEPSGVDGRAELDVSGATWTLADAGRSGSRRARARAGSALATPWGPRANVAGSRSAGFGIGASAGPDVIAAGVEAVRAKVSEV